MHFSLLPSSLMSYDKLKGFPPQTPSFFLKNSQINRVTKVSSTFGPTESDSEKIWVLTLILGEETGFEIACISICDICNT